MESTFLGPYVVLMVRGKYATLASLSTPRKTVANSDNLTHFIEPEERIPAKLKKVGTSPLASPSPPPPPPTPPTPSSPDPPLGTLPGERQPSQSNSTFSYVTLSIIRISKSVFSNTIMFSIYSYSTNLDGETGRGDMVQNWTI